MCLPVRSFSACVNSGSAPHGPRQVVAGCPIHGVLANYLGLHALSRRRRHSSYCRDVRDCLSRPIAHQSFVHTKRKIKSCLQRPTPADNVILLLAFAAERRRQCWSSRQMGQTDRLTDGHGAVTTVTLTSPPLCPVLK